ncbi:MAG: KamA family radical SAM protein, partial [Candidatus Altiarchaeales archaeon]|nr:KamA family radical SAM protein [Candidatus Altiarchaeales archaeon]
MVVDVLDLDKLGLLRLLWKTHPRIHFILRDSEGLPEARTLLFDYLNRLEKHYFNIYSDKRYKNIHILEKNNAKECIRVLKNVIRSENEKLTGVSALKTLRKLAKGNNKKLSSVSPGFLAEFYYLLKGIKGDSGIRPKIYTTIHENPTPLDEANKRSRRLDHYSQEMRDYFSRYHVGYDPRLKEKRRLFKEDILDYFGGIKSDWGDWRWHMKNIVSDRDTLGELIELSGSERQGLYLADKYGIPYQITPHYLSLWDRAGRESFDRVLRAQVLPSKTYCRNIVESRRKGLSMDFMEESSTSPVEGITRRYPQILILKPYDSCPQICVYCQRNWEVKGIGETDCDLGRTFKAIDWISDNPHITEVLITGGDPLTLGNDTLDDILGGLAEIDHIQRIRIGTRTLVTVPQRIDDGFTGLLDKYLDIGRRDVTVMTHFEHPVEFTYDSLYAVEKIKKKGVNIYNQQVFTYYTSRRYETCFLRKVLKKSGIDPYYTFNTKGKKETIDFRVPLSRIEQEAKEEARLLPGLDRTDEAVFNVPR